MDKFNEVDRLILISDIGRTLEDKLGNASHGIAEMRSNLEAVGLSVDKINVITEQLSVAAKYASYMRNLAAFGTSGVDTVDFNLECTIQEIRERDEDES